MTLKQVSDKITAEILPKISHLKHEFVSNHWVLLSVWVSPRYVKDMIFYGTDTPLAIETKFNLLKKWVGDKPTYDNFPQL